jgi:hypothetical protein
VRARKRRFRLLLHRGVLDRGLHARRTLARGRTSDYRYETLTVAHPYPCSPPGPWDGCFSLRASSSASR